MDKKLKLTSKVIDKLIIEKMDYFTHSINLLCEYRENCISCPMNHDSHACYYYLLRHIVFTHLENEITDDLYTMQAEELDNYDKRK